MIIKRERSPLAIILLAVLLVVIACVSLTFGQIDVPVGKALAVIGSQLNLPGFTEADYSREQLAVIWYIRLPRMLVGVLVGAALGISGAVMQGIFSNPLADPGLIGISSGAATGAVLSIALGAASGSMFAMPAFAFCGSICAVCLTVFLAMRNGKIPCYDAAFGRRCRGYAFGCYYLRPAYIYERAEAAAISFLDGRRS